MNLILSILYFYVAVYSLFFLIMALKNLSNKKFAMQKRHSHANYQNNLCIILYAQNNQENLQKIITQLKEQTYAIENYSIFLVLDNCSDNSEQFFQYDNMVQVFSIKDQGTVGKDQAISILLENLSSNKMCDAFVFLDANRFIDKDFLETINAGLLDSPAISGSTVLLGENLSLRQKIKMAYHKYYTNFLQKSRAIMGLAMTIDSDIFVIRYELLNKIGCINFRNINDELKYSLLLSKLGYRCLFNPNVKTYIGVDDFKLRIPSLSSRLDLFKDCIPQTFGATLNFTEHVYSLLNPNILILLIVYEFLMEYSFEYYFIVDFSVVLVSFCLLMLGFAISLVNSKLKGKEYLYLFLYPVYSLSHIFKNFPVCRFVRNRFTGNIDKQSVEKFVVNVEVTDGKRHIPCIMHLISESGLAKVKFIYNKKKFITKTHLRMVDAISELVNKLSDYGLVLKICQCCANFSQNIDGSTNMVKGFCNQQFAVTQEGQIPTLLWNSCKGFTQVQQQSLMEEISG